MRVKAIGKDRNYEFYVVERARFVVTCMVFGFYPQGNSGFCAMEPSVKVQNYQMNVLFPVNWDDESKYLLTLDFDTSNIEGIQKVNVIDWLLSGGIG